MNQRGPERVEGASRAGTCGRFLRAGGVHGIKEVAGDGGGVAGGPRLHSKALKRKSNRMGWPHRGHSGEPEAVCSGKGLVVAPNWTGLPECNWTRIRLALAAGWQNP
jgi:hypothetical protein